jgi:hypothetical protein
MEYSMKSGKKRGKKKGRRWTFKSKYTYGLVAGIFVVSCFLIYFFLNAENQTHVDDAPKAAIVDHLSDSHPNQTFVATSKSILRNAGFNVYYYSKEAVDVNFYRNLPNLDFDVIILRVHSAVNEASDLLVFFTSEPFNDLKAGTIYLSDFLSDPPRLVRAMIYEGSDPYFGITPSFVDSMNGEFDDTLILMMGCNGLDPAHTSMADALINKGAKVCIGWNELVSSFHTDHAITHLLQKLFAEKKTIQTAVDEINSEVGPDPTYKSKFSWYPLERGHYSFQNNTD